MNTSERAASRRNNFQRHLTAPAVEATSNSSAAGRRKKSRSPDSRTSHPHANAQRGESSQAAAVKKRKPTTVPSAPAPAGSSFLVALDDPDRGRKPKGKSRHTARPATENSSAITANHAELPSHRFKKRERSKSRDSAHYLATKSAASDVESTTKDSHIHFDGQAEYSGPFAAAEFARLKREIETLKKQAHENKRTIRKQTKIIEELKQQETTNAKALKDSEQHALKLQNKSRRTEEIIDNIETNTQCQICMELLFKPYALSPCGHVLCVSCLQEWFRKAPGGDGDMYDDDDPNYLVYRRKACPCCRTDVRHRPIPVFMIKAIASALLKAKGASLSTPAHRGSPTIEGDPWEGLFPADDEMEGYDESDDEDDEDDDEDDDDEDEDEDDIGWMDDVFSYGTDSDDETYHGPHAAPQWEPPTVMIDEDDYLFEQLDQSDINVLRRGGTLSMLEEYEMEYSHEHGLLLHEGYNRIYLGWNIKLSADDEAGDIYVQWLLQDMMDRPDRWRIRDLEDGSYEAQVLIPEADVFDYPDTDSDNYMEPDDLD
ncbi:hypothetical protein BV22DRAFT_1035491 [Leucogyrophana mollusca]|uniref:Uncharacterized protein n=1 Tax=Leucogyrophana mollusca TaxID=85980 RepID=A0ACB8BH76_9AGAM|nr:hypothetical protein BV22DRAFT_1035491 [Leucogyrophana mollusca]